MVRRTILLTLLVLLASAPGLAENGEREIRYLLDSIAASGCSFTRNGSEHSAAEAAAHLAMKYDRAGSRIATAEQFVERLASESSFTGEPYLITCAGTSTPSRDWLMERLDRHRAGAKS
jgi:hypothetical protein